MDTELMNALVVLDIALTGKHNPNTNASQITTIDFYCGDRQYYLSDGGYSRVYWSEYESEVCLDSVSRIEVKALWGYCITERMTIEGIMKAWELKEASQ